ncbi:MAG: hypothetical protein COA70_13970 [Planctomycetota bacterium]|nr:MAG: hypothetical protein COA70_13970 [Planctomycetota bacterium]
MPYLHITTHLDDHKDEALFAEIGGRGFPTLKFMNADGQVIGEPSGRDVASFETSLESLMVVTNLENRIAKGEKGLENELFLAKMRLGLFDFEEAKAEFASLKKLTKEQKSEIKGLLVNLEVMSIMDSIDSDEAAVAAGAKFKAMLDDGVIPTGDSMGAYWSIIMTYAESKSDADLFEKCLHALKEKYGAEEGAKPFFEQKAEVLKKMREEVKVDS